MVASANIAHCCAKDTVPPNLGSDPGHAHQTRLASAGMKMHSRFVERTAAGFS